MQSNVVPGVREFLKPVLLVLSGHEDGLTNMVIEEEVINLMGFNRYFNEASYEERCSIARKIAFAKSCLKQNGLITNVSRGVWKSTNTIDNMEDFDPKDLCIYRAGSEIKSIFTLANNAFLAREISLIKSDVSERCICAALKEYLSNELRKYRRYNDYKVDVEYNRNAGHIKTIIDSNYVVVNITCDLIVHSRGKLEKHDNLLALEMKKSSRTEDEKKADRNRLMALTKPKNSNEVWSYDGKTYPKYVCGYVVGVYYELDIPKGKVYLEYYKHGNLLYKETLNLPPA